MTVKKQAKHFYEGLVIKIGSAQDRVGTSRKRRIGTIKQRDVSFENASREDDSFYEKDAETLALFLNLAMKDIHDNPSSLEAYTEAMSAEDDELLAGVEVDW